MEPVVYDRTPLADYLKGTMLSAALCATPRDALCIANTPMADEGDGGHDYWGPAGDSGSTHDESPPSSPTFAPVGRPMVKKRFRSQRPESLQLDMTPTARISSLHNRYSVSYLPYGLAEFL